MIHFLFALVQLAVGTIQGAVVRNGACDFGPDDGADDVGWGMLDDELGNHLRQSALISLVERRREAERGVGELAYNGHVRAAVRQRVHIRLRREALHQSFNSATLLYDRARRGFGGWDKVEVEGDLTMGDGVVHYGDRSQRRGGQRSSDGDQLITDALYAHLGGAVVDALFQPSRKRARYC